MKRLEEVTILGLDMITPQELARVYGGTHRESCWLPGTDLLNWCRLNNYVAVPGPPKFPSLSALRTARPHLFFGIEPPWFSELPFAKEEKLGPGWLFLRKEPVPNSIGATWQLSKQLLLGDELVPTAIAVAWAIVVFFDIRGIRLFSDQIVRTSSHTPNGRRIGIGGFDAHGIELGAWEDLDKKDFLGTAAAHVLPAQ